MLPIQQCPHTTVITSLIVSTNGNLQEADFIIQKADIPLITNICTLVHLLTGHWQPANWVKTKKCCPKCQRKFGSRRINSRLQLSLFAQRTMSNILSSATSLNDAPLLRAPRLAWGAKQEPTTKLHNLLLKFRIAEPENSNLIRVNIAVGHLGLVQ